MRPFDSGSSVSFTMAGELQVQRSDARAVDLSRADGGQPCAGAEVPT
jgi:hypothetical protein